MKTADWTLNQDDGELRILTGVAGPAAKMGHRLTIVMQSWQAAVAWADDALFDTRGKRSVDDGTLRRMSLR